MSHSPSLISRVVLAVIALASNSSADQPLYIDFNPDNGRSDVRSPHASNWPIATCRQVEQRFGNLSLQLAAIGGDQPELTFGWWKAGYDFGATFCSDGITTVAVNTEVELRISRLSAGTHSLATWHSDWNNSAPDSELSAIDIQWHVGNQNHSATIEPTQRVKHDDEAASYFFEFEISEGEILAVRFKPKSDRGRVVLNGLAIDVPDPAWSITKAIPQDGDEHVQQSPILTWQPPRAISSDAAMYSVYFGTDIKSVKNASIDSPEFMGTTRSTQWNVTASDCLQDYFWRVDVQRASGEIVRGTVKRFKVRELAFPRAEGYGRFAIGGRGGQVIEVSNLQDAGPGSLRSAIDAEGPRTIVFRVGGTIQLQSKLVVRNPYVTIAGETAPGDGICVRGYTFGCMGTHDVIMRHLRIRVGDEAGETMDGTGFASSDHTIFDHCSISWSIDEAVSSRSAKNITLQRCIIAEALNVANHRKYQAGKGHSFAGSISGDIGSFHHNLVAHCAGRNWSLAGGLDRGGHYAGRLDIRNNVIYNWESRTNDGGAKAVNLVNNLYLPGPASRVFHLLKPDAGSEGDRQQYFVSGNRMEGRFDESGDNWREAVTVSPELIDSIRLNEPFCEPHVQNTFG